MMPTLQAGRRSGSSIGAHVSIGAIQLLQRLSAAACLLASPAAGSQAGPTNPSPTLAGCAPQLVVVLEQVLVLVGGARLLHGQLHRLLQHAADGGQVLVKLVL
jgi:hypothetical protein